LNGFNLGRYWERGSQKTLYVPAPLLKRGVNELIVFELHGAQNPVIEFRDKPELR
jgi:beta-galactosidase